VKRRYRCQLERFGAPPWTCRLILVLLGVFVLGYAALITAADSASRSPFWFVPAIWLLAGVALLLLYRGWMATYARSDDAGDAKPAAGAPSSNNRLERP
jgi:protein-S-isoprenylcysteine O-methyltransferase Ste14